MNLQAVKGYVTQGAHIVSQAAFDIGQKVTSGIASLATSPFGVTAIAMIGAGFFAATVGTYAAGKSFGDWNIGSKETSTILNSGFDQASENAGLIKSAMIMITRGLFSGNLFCMTAIGVGASLGLVFLFSFYDDIFVQRVT